MEPTKTEIIVQVDTDGTEVVFKDYSKLVEWLSSEVRAWDWTRPESTTYVNAFDTHMGTVHSYANQINAATDETSANNILESLVTHLTKAYSSGHIFTSYSDEGKFILSLRDENTITASGAINFFKDLTIPVNSYNRSFDTDLQKQIKGHILANNHRSGLLNEDQVRKRLKGILSETTKSAKMLFEALTLDLNASREEYEKHNGGLLQLSESFSSVIVDSEKKAQETVQHLKDRAEEVEKIYREKVQLQAPTQYFNTQAASHTEEARKYFRIFTGITLAFLAGFCGLVYLLFVHIQFVKDLEKYLILTAFFAVGTWFVRTYYRIYINHQHLKTVSGEKEVLVKVYLSLLESDKGLSKEDRALILAPLFRVPQNVFSRDDSGPGSPLEILMRHIQK